MLCQWLPSPSTTTRRLVLENLPSLGLPALIRSRAFLFSLRTTSYIEYFHQTSADVDILILTSGVRFIQDRGIAIIGYTQCRVTCFEYCTDHDFKADYNQGYLWTNFCLHLYRYYSDFDFRSSFYPR